MALRAAWMRRSVCCPPHALFLVTAQVLDLEGLANHRGSSFGWIAMPERQPTSEQFQNDCALQWRSFDPSRWVFVEVH